MDNACKDINVCRLASDIAILNYKSGLNCSESVFDALIRSKALKVPPETRSMAVGFGGGIGLTGNTCGALLAAIMANAAIYGRPDPWLVDAELRGLELREKYYRRYNNIVHDFKKANGAVSCRDICSSYKEWNIKERRVMCLKLIGATALMACEYLFISQEEAFKLPYSDNIGGME